MLFRGRSHRSLDPKGRLMLPPDFRDILMSRAEGGKLVLTSFDDCVMGYPLPDWEDFERKFSTLKNPSRKMRDFRRLVIGSAELMELDGQGRVRISRSHMDYAGITKDVVLLGQGSRFEIWDQGRFDGIVTQDFDDVAAELADSGIELSL
uniref:Transcriptional regulator MraZ n=1 Tax=Nitratidesulfovibrio vulgaris (strain DSM 19637 / Miyazaki F) TaxID=883 RepID=MRAZ_NITV9|nr:RecName: Full=Transcriptional regulator MraZ [Nitratidesulfovibrio vulgaris str. 'Miyazaki F']